MNRRAAIASVIVLGSARRAVAKGGQDQRTAVRLLATCDAIQATGKRRQSWIFKFKVASVIEGRYEQPFIGFELYQGGAQGGERLLVILDGKSTLNMGEVSVFDRGKVVELAIELRSEGPYEYVLLRDFKPVEQAR